VNLLETRPTLWQLRGQRHGKHQENSMPSIRQRIRSTQSPDGGIVLDIDKGKMFSLNSTGSVIFRLLEKQYSEERIVEEMVRLFEIPADVVKRDLRDFYDSLKHHVLVAGNEISAGE
jgi:hypothetical protein